MSAEYKEPTADEMEYMHGFASLLMSEEWLAEQILNGGERDVWNEHVARIEAIINGQLKEVLTEKDGNK